MRNGSADRARRRELARELHQNGSSYPAIAAETGMSAATVRRWLDPEFAARVNGQAAEVRVKRNGAVADVWRELKDQVRFDAERSSPLAVLTARVQAVAAARRALADRKPDAHLVLRGALIDTASVCLVLAGELPADAEAFAKAHEPERGPKSIG